MCAVLEALSVGDGFMFIHLLISYCYSLGVGPCAALMRHRDDPELEQNHL